MNLRTGVDLIEIERFEETVQRYGDRFLQRVFTEGELQECALNAASLAARFAAKEAVSKALGTGIGAVGWLEIEIRRGPAREPVLRLHGAAARLANELGLTTWSVSLSHTFTHALALAVAVGDPGQ
jgi:holo-[acyl-carrier protein] synthase